MKDVIDRFDFFSSSKGYIITRSNDRQKMLGGSAEGGGTRSVGIGRLLLFVYVLFGCGGLSLCQVASNNDTSPDVFIEHCRRECAIYKNMMACGKYKAIKWINNVVQEKVIGFFLRD